MGDGKERGSGERGSETQRVRKLKTGWLDICIEINQLYRLEAKKGGVEGDEVQAAGYQHK